MNTEDKDQQACLSGRQGTTENDLNLIKQLEIIQDQLSEDDHRAMAATIGELIARLRDRGTDAEKFVFIPRQYEKEDIEAHFDVKLSDEEFQDFAEFTRDNDGTMDLIDRDIQAAFKYWKETRESERMRI